MVAIPNVSLSWYVCEKPIFCKIEMNFLSSGKAITDSGKYEYAELSFETIRPINGKILRK